MTMASRKIGLYQLYLLWISLGNMTLNMVGSICAALPKVAKVAKVANVA